MKNSTFRTWLLLPACLMIAAMMLRPQETINAAASALELWARAVVPSLLPFFILAELLVALGGAEVAGRRLAPLMRPLFHLPGAASLAVVMGFCSGFPTGAAVTAALRRQGAITAEEGGRLLAFTNNAGPLYVTVAVAYGLLELPAAAPVLVAGHYGINLLLGIGLGLLFRKREQDGSAPAAAVPQKNASSAAMMKAAAQRAAANLLLIGSYMAFFGAAAELLTPEGLSEHHPLLQAAVCGVLEMSLGVDAWAQSGLSAPALLPLVAAQLALGGLSVQMQVLALTADTDISPRLYLLSRPLHALLAAAFTRGALRLITLPASLSGVLPRLPAGRGLLRHSLLVAGLIGLCWLLFALPAPGGREKDHSSG